MSMNDYFVEYVKENIGDVAYCKLTGERCGTRQYPDVDCRSCVVPVYMAILRRNEERQPRVRRYRKGESE